VRGRQDICACRQRQRSILVRQLDHPGPGSQQRRLPATILFVTPLPHRIVLGDNLAVLATVPAGCAALVYIDPPFNTGRRQERQRMQVTRDDAHGERRGFGGKRYRASARVGNGFADAFADYRAFLAPRLLEAHRILQADGSFFLHVDYREVHYCKVLLDEVFGRECFMNEIIWAYDYGARSKRRWPCKHDNILWYARDPAHYVFDFAAMDRIPYLAPGLVGAEKAARGKTPTDVWWQTIVSPTGKEKTGYATQKPLAILERIVRVHSRPGDLVVDFFAGSGTTGEAAARHGRRFLLVDDNPEAVRIMTARLRDHAPAVEAIGGVARGAQSGAEQ
jgi:site-specific DNA-methyltransferase (adenine-specific)